jgi:hypothetical protein
MDPNLPLRSIPGFFVQLYWGQEHGVKTWVIEGNDSQIYKAPLHITISDVSKSIMCTIHLPHVYLSNTATRTWRCLTLPSREGQDLIYVYFDAMAFDVSTRCCTIIVGQHDYHDQTIDIKKLVMEIYDS